MQTIQCTPLGITFLLATPTNEVSTLFSADITDGFGVAVDAFFNRSVTCLGDITAPNLTTLLNRADALENGEVDLTNYYKKVEVWNKDEIGALINNLDHYTTSESDARYYRKLDV